MIIKNCKLPADENSALTKNTNYLDKFGDKPCRTIIYKEL